MTTTKRAPRRGLGRIAIIDLGTNSVRFDVHETGPGQEARLVHREKLMVRLGENLFSGGRLDRDAVRRTLQAFRGFEHTANGLRVDKIVAFGTSALREARDRDQLVDGIRAAVGIDVRVISGRDEAKLIAKGILAKESGLGDDFALVDIGGGSTEISLCRDGRTIFCDSFPLGAARLQQVFLRHPVPEREALRAMRRHVREMLGDRLPDRERGYLERIVGSSGTAKALVKLARKAGLKTIERDWLEVLVKDLRRLSLEQLRRYPGMEPRRADIILAGAILLEECMDALGARKVQFTEYSLRDGILQREVQLMELQHRWDSDVDLEPLYEQAARFGESIAHLKCLVALAEQLFTRLAPLHRLGARWLTYLKLAVLFRNAGKAVSPINHERHSYYIVRHADLPLYESWETEFVAHLCLRHESGRLDTGSVEFPAPELVGCERRFDKLLAILRLIDALDPALHRGVNARRLRIERNTVLLSLRCAARGELALLRLQQKKVLFEKVFHRELLATV